MSVADATPSSENWLVAVGKLDPAMPFTLIQLDSGRIVSVPTLLLTTDALVQSYEAAREPETVTIPVLAEELVIGKRQVPLETVRLTRSVETRTETVEIPLLKEHWEVTRIPRDEEVQERFGARQDGDATVYPVFEERAVTRTALFLVEELRIEKLSETIRQPVDVALDRDVLSVERFQP